jgi:hypothetical protein
VDSRLVDIVDKLAKRQFRTRSDRAYSRSLKREAFAPFQRERPNNILRRVRGSRGF